MRVKSFVPTLYCLAGGIGILLADCGQVESMPAEKAATEKGPTKTGASAQVEVRSQVARSTKLLTESPAP